MSALDPKLNASTVVYPLVTLADGRQVSSGSMDFLLECEARKILFMGSMNERRAALTAIGLKRGESARRDLERRILDLWECEKERL